MTNIYEKLKTIRYVFHFLWINCRILNILSIIYKKNPTIQCTYWQYTTTTEYNEDTEDTANIDYIDNTEDTAVMQ